MTTPLPGGEWPFRGRDDLVEAALEAAHDPACTGVALVGPPGVGKTRVASAIVEGIDAAAVRLQASEALAGVPFGVLAAWLPVGAVNPSGDVDADVVAEHVRQLVGPAQRLVLLVDELAHLDEGTRALLAQLRAAGSAFLVGTARTVDGVPADVRRLDVAPLSRPAVADVLEAALGAPVDAAAVESIWQVSQGNPLYVRELVLAGLEAHELQRGDGGMWHLRTSLPPSRRLHDLVVARLSAVPDAAGHALRLLAVAGPLSVDGLDAAVAALVERDLVAVDQPAKLARLAHPLYGEVLRASLRTLERRRLLQQAIEHVSGSGAHAISAEDELRIAGWELELGHRPSTDVLVRGARRARSVLDHPSAVRFAGAVLDDQGAETPLEVRRILVEALTFTGANEHAEHVAASQPLDGLDRDDEAELMRLVAARIYNVLWFLRDVSAARAVLEEVRPRFASLEGRQHLRLREAYVRSFEGDAPGSLAVLEGVADEGGWSPSVAAAGEAAVAQARLIVGRCADARRAAEAASAALGDRPDAPAPTYDPALVHHLLGRTATWLGRFDEAGRVLTAAHRDAARVGVGFTRAALAIALGDLAMLRGRVATARRWFSEATVAAGAAQNPTLRTIALGSLAMAAGQLRQTDIAPGLLVELDTLAEGDEALVVGGDEVAAGRAWLLSALGRPAEGRQVLLDAADRSLARGELLDSLVLLVEVARLGAASDVRSRVVEVGASVDGPVAEVMVSHVVATASRTVDALEHAVERAASLGCDLFAAEAARALGQALRRRGDVRGAARALDRGDDLAARCEGASTPGLTVVDAVVPLSPREREIAELAASGLSNPEIAERLFVSVRTVGNHLQNVYTKLGISGRTDLRERM